MKRRVLINTIALMILASGCAEKDVPNVANFYLEKPTYGSIVLENVTEIETSPIEIVTEPSGEFMTEVTTMTEPSSAVETAFQPTFPTMPDGPTKELFGTRTEAAADATTTTKPNKTVLTYTETPTRDPNATFQAHNEAYNTPVTLAEGNGVKIVCWGYSEAQTSNTQYAQTLRISFLYNDVNMTNYFIDAENWYCDSVHSELTSIGDGKYNGTTTIAKNQLNGQDIADVTFTYYNKLPSLTNISMKFNLACPNFYGEKPVMLSVGTLMMSREKISSVGRITSNQELINAYVAKSEQIKQCSKDTADKPVVDYPHNHK